MASECQRLGILPVTVGLGLLVIGEADSLALWRVDSQAACPEVEQPPKSPTPRMGVLVGRVTRGPVSSIEDLDGRLGHSPAANIRIVISSVAGEAVTSGMTDRRGDYRVDLPSGTYRVGIASLAEMEYTKDLPAMVTVSAGQETRLDFHIDTGIR